MNDRPRIIAGLVVAMAALIFPLWYTVASGPATPPPELQKPKGHSQCVADAAYMRAHHMEILNQWRDDVVRQGDCGRIDIEGKSYPKSLTGACMACHTSNENFCACCHNYAAVQLTCWECHVDPGAKHGDHKEK
jgi:hypothetical protein